MCSNILYLASAGSGKTTQIARETTSLIDNVLIVTYTNENCSNIINKIEMCDITKQNLYPRDCSLG